MPSLFHEALVTLFRDRPSLAAEIVRDVLACPLPHFDSVRIEDSNLAQAVPTEYRADLVVLLERGVPVHGIVLEVQLTPDRDKRFSWPYYAAALRARLRCPTCVLVVTPDEHTARWASAPIDTGQPASPFVPLVLGPRAMPRITDADVAVRAPEQALLSAFAHGNEPAGLDVVMAALTGAAGLDEERAVLYFDLLYLAAGEAVRRHLEELMEKKTWEAQSPLARKYLADVAKGRAEGEAMGRAEGEAMGRAEGEAMGRVEGLARAVVTLLGARGFQISDELRERIRACTDVDVLDHWVARAAVAESVAELFDESRDSEE